MRKIYSKPKRISNKKPHIRWNFENNAIEISEALRYHFVVVHYDGFKRESILEDLIQVMAPLHEVRKVEGKVKRTNLKYILTTYESRIAPEYVKHQLLKSNLPIKKDLKLRERKTNSGIEDYIARIYG